MNETEISWTQLTWNPMSGCKKISPECAFCYADQLASDKEGTAAFPHGFGLTPRPHKVKEPARIKEPSLIFCNSMSDPGLGDDELTNVERERLVAAGYADMEDLRDAFFDGIEAAPRHRYQVLTKRPENVLAYLSRRGRKLPACVWMGVTLGHRKSMYRLPLLHRFREFGARVLFISAEPLLGDLGDMRLDGIDWIITGGESGRHASDPRVLADRFLVERTPPEDVAADRRAVRRGDAALVPPWRPRADRVGWVRRLRDEADRAGCRHFFKQWGGPKPTSGGRLLDGRTHDGMPDHIPGAMPEGYVHKTLVPKGADKVQLPMFGA